VLIAWTPYGKHDPAPIAVIYPASGAKVEWMSDHTIFEAPDPVYWCAHGYAILTIDIPGLWYAQSPAHLIAPEEAEALADAIEWAGTRDWSNGKVGMSGVSYLAVSQWRVAALNPPHLAAICPWEGWTDTYREVVYHGGIPDTYFWPYIQTRWGASDHMVEDLWAETVEHSFYDSFWESKSVRLEDIRVPAFVVGSWSDHGLHSRGTLEGFRRMSSDKKWLLVHGRKKWAHYYDPENVEKQRAFFDHFLKGVTSEPDWPKVQYEIRSRVGEQALANSTAWPLSEVSYRRFFLDAASAALSASEPAERSSVAYDSLSEDGEAIFDLRFDEDTAIVGHAWLHLQFTAEHADDADIFVTIEKLDAGGARVGFAHYAIFEDGPVALGWLRLSQRQLDQTQTTEFLPVLAHRQSLKVEPGEVIEADIEVLPSGTQFAVGERLRLRITGRDGRTYPRPLIYARHEETVNRGKHRIWTGGENQSWLQLPTMR
jgi:putative CocE/NonD family hydrolase